MNRLALRREADEQQADCSHDQQELASDRDQADEGIAAQDQQVEPSLKNGTRR